MAQLEAKNIDKPDERRNFPNGHLELIDLPDFWLAGRASPPGGAGRSR
jgi:hypothetical protein